MAFVVEDGTGVPGATAYVTVSEANDFFLDTGRFTEWDQTSAIKKEALVTASFYVDQVFGQRFLGFRLNRIQGLRWPRSGVFLDNEEIPEDEIPEELRKAVMEYALTSLLEELLPEPSPSGKILERVKIGPLEEEIEWSDSGTEIIQSRPVGDTWISFVLRDTQGKVIR